MKTAFSIILAVISPALVFAGVNFTMTLDNAEVLQHESMYVYLHIQNDSDLPLVIDPSDASNPAKIDFKITRSGEEIERISPEKSIVGKQIIKPDETRKLMIDISKWYRVGQMGKYVITPVVTDYEGTYQGDKKVIDVVYGGRLTKVVKAAPGRYDGRRVYQLLYWNRKGYERLFLRVDSEDGRYNFGVVELGTLIRVMTPSLKVDRHGNVEVFHQSMPETYVRTMFKSNYDGLVFLGQNADAGSLHIPKNMALDDESVEAPSRSSR